MGLGADMEPRPAARRAVLEAAQVRPALRQRMRLPEVRRRIEELLDDPRRVADLEDHDLLYASAKTLRNFDFLRRNSLASISWEHEDAASPLVKLRCLADHFRDDEHRFALL